MRVRVGGAEPVAMNLETYTAHVVAAEMPASWPMDALRAQAVASRTYALATRKHDADGYDVCTDSHCCQAYRMADSGPDVPERVARAVAETAGIIGLQNGALRPTYYSARCGGQTLDDWGPSWLKARYCPCSAGDRPGEVLGHRNGLCQYGARYLAEAGYSWRDILNYYYDLDWTTVHAALGVCPS